MFKSLVRTINALHAGQGQALAEFAIAFPLQLLITFGLLQLGLIYVANITVDYAAFRSARAAIVVAGRPEMTKATPETIKNKQQEVAQQAAALVLSPLAGSGRSKVGTEDQAFRIPGWGDLHGHREAQEKTLVQVFYPDTQPDSLVAAVEFDYELMFPFIDAIFYVILGKNEELPKDERFFGDVNRADVKNHYRNRDPVYDIATRRGRKVGRVRYLNNVPHLILFQECTLFDAYAAMRNTQW